jgi:hypothetical protein
VAGVGAVLRVADQIGDDVIGADRAGIHRRRILQKRDHYGAWIQSGTGVQGTKYWNLDGESMEGHPLPPTP